MALGEPSDLLGATAVPGAVLAFGTSLRPGPRPVAGGTCPEVAVVAALEPVVQPLTAWLAGRFALGLDVGPLSVVVLASSPAAQDVLVHVTRYRTGQLLARDAIVTTTVLSAPVVLLVAAPPARGPPGSVRSWHSNRSATRRCSSSSTPPRRWS